MSEIYYLSKGPFRYTQRDENYILEEKDEYTHRYKTIYTFCNMHQMCIAMEDFEYTKLLAGKPAYVKDVVTNPYPNR
jgi:hypothetical protein